MFAFLGGYLWAVSAHRLISEGRGVLLLHTRLPPGMWAFLCGKCHVGEFTGGHQGLVPMLAAVPRLPAAMLEPAGVLLLLSIGEGAVGKAEQGGRRGP